MLDIDIVKSFLRVDYDEDDSLIEFEIQAARDYIRNAVGVFVDGDKLMELLAMKLVCDMYDKRTYTVAENEKSSYTTKSMITQLQFKYGGDSCD